MGNTVFGAHQGKHLFSGIERDREPGLVPAGDRCPERLHAGIGRVMVIRRIVCGIAEGFHNVVRGGEIRVSHAKVDDIRAAPDLRGLHLIDPRKEIRGELPHTFRVHAGIYSPRRFIKVIPHRDGLK